MTDSITGIRKKLIATYDSEVLGREGTRVPPADFTFVSLGKYMGEVEYVQVAFLKYPKTKELELHHYFLKYPGDHAAMPDEFLEGDNTIIGYDEAGALLAYNGDRQWIDGPRCEKAKKEKNG